LTLCTENINQALGEKVESNTQYTIKSPMCSQQCEIYSQNILQTHSHYCISREQFRVVESDLHVEQEHW
jgi:hypothetical protein